VLFIKVRVQRMFAHETFPIGLGGESRVDESNGRSRQNPVTDDTISSLGGFITNQGPDVTMGQLVPREDVGRNGLAS
jgi:hypothetical protein